MKCQTCKFNHICSGRIDESVGECCKRYKSIEQTNEEWFCNLPTEEKARFFSHEMRCEFCPNQEQCDSLGANCKVLWELWLKQPHTPKE